MGWFRLPSPVLIGGAVALSLFLSSTGSSQHVPPPPGCLDLLQQGPAETVSLDITKTIMSVPGFVCVRVLNGFSKPILSSPRGMRLQKRREVQGQVRDFQNVKPVPAKAWGQEASNRIPAHGVMDWQLPQSKQPTAPGIYRVCFSYTFGGQKTFREVCSQEFSLSKGEDLQPLPGCPRLPEQGPRVNRISIHVEKTLDKPGVVCVRVLNGLDTRLLYGVSAFRLHKVDAGGEEQKDPSSAATEGSSQGIPIVPQTIGYGLEAGGHVDRYLPGSLLPASPGRYQTCFRYDDQYDGEQVCSEVFSLP